MKRIQKWVLLALVMPATFGQIVGAGEDDKYRGASTYQDNARAKLMLGSEQLMGAVVMEPRLRAVGLLTQAQVAVQNRTETLYTLEYKFDWLDDEGFAVGTLNSWHRFTLGPHQRETFSATGQVPEATQIVFTVRFPDDHFIPVEQSEQLRNVEKLKEE